ncbi:hypothetical protein WB44_01165 [Synechococcus sp. WH 8020]|uniref:hypothetical protein n=1 Tax=Synechococcus sp. (strain WH8020) TaxID=32052 RepID=UPI0006527858|nr:hypothetical protein [Synechococcus sp. WH 8020]AKN59963.1 hypothetical protein WB44_01165 [Synechococcus sp. WH 8020]
MTAFLTVTGQGIAEKYFPEWLGSDRATDEKVIEHPRLDLVNSFVDGGLLPTWISQSAQGRDSRRWTTAL